MSTSSTDGDASRDRSRSKRVKTVPPSPSIATPPSPSIATLELTPTGRSKKNAKKAKNAKAKNIAPKVKGSFEDDTKHVVHTPLTFSPSDISPRLPPVESIPNLLTTRPIYGEHSDISVEATKSIAVDAEIAYLKKQLSEVTKLLSQQQSKPFQVQSVSSVKPTVSLHPEANTASFDMPPPQAGFGCHSMQFPVVPIQSESDTLMKPSTIYPAAASNYWQYNYMMQLQRDTIRAQVERDIELDRSKEYRIKAQELLIQQSIASHNAMFGYR